MAKKKVAKKPKKRVSKTKRPVYICRTCGMEVVVSKAGVGITNLVCCDQVMEKK
jgi:ribosomal protein L37AE/L43A